MTTTSQSANLAAVNERIAGAIMDFCVSAVGLTFRAEDLRSYVTEVTGPSAPGSADRVLRDLRQKGALDYTVINRKQSLYRLAWAVRHYHLIP